MALQCSQEIAEALEGMQFPATKDDLLDYASYRDAREAVLVALNRLDDDAIYQSVAEVCENAEAFFDIDE